MRRCSTGDRLCLRICVVTIQSCERKRSENVIGKRLRLISISRKPKNLLTRMHSSRCIFWLACRELWLCKSHQVVDSVFTYLAEPLQEHLRLGEAKNPNAFHYLSTIFPPGQNGLLSHSRSDNQD
mmetsp:Transcript_45432/g.98903  ORF Transcript_45432/g.98903 Transcript_45432/m.98903 type:complete len:125 (+) Transcript_45432:648-1022(+)